MDKDNERDFDIDQAVSEAIVVADMEGKAKAKLWHAPDWVSKENRLRITDMIRIMGMNDQGLFEVNGQYWRFGRDNDYAIAERVEALDAYRVPEKPVCTNTRIDDDGICAMCGEKHLPYGRAPVPHSKSLTERMEMYREWWAKNNPNMGKPPPEKVAEDERAREMYLTDLE